jgi:catechol 2,3-dioxygenase-like lactoylglutathione lyase family enzyme
VKGTLNHIQYNIVSEKTKPFYKDLLGYFGMNVLYEDDNMLGVGDGHVSLWFLAPQGDQKPIERDAGGMNHLGIHVDSAAEVDEFQRDFMKPRGIEALFETPRARPEFGGSYYQVMFVDPEGLAIEVFHA